MRVRMKLYTTIMAHAQIMTEPQSKRTQGSVYATFHTRPMCRRGQYVEVEVEVEPREPGPGPDWRWTIDVFAVEGPRAGAHVGRLCSTGTGCGWPEVFELRSAGLAALAASKG